MPAPEERRPLRSRLLGSSARALAGATGLDDAIEVAVEDAVVAYIESPAFERTVARVLESKAVERAAIEALDSELVDRIWIHILRSEEAQQLVERIAEAPEVRAAITSQGVGLLEDLGRQLASVSREFDDRLERVVRRLIRRPQREARTDSAGLATRGLAIIADFGVINLAFIGISALLSLVFGRGGDSSVKIVVGVGAWILIGSAYLATFWALAGQTPGMRLLGIRIEAGGSRRLGMRRSIRRVIGLGLALLPLGLGLIGVIASDRRRGFHDRRAGTEVIYTPRAAPYAQ